MWSDLTPTHSACVGTCICCEGDMDVKRRQRIEALTALLHQYRWLLDSYVIEFFTEHHWEKLPQSWQTALSGADMREVGQVLLSHQRETAHEDQRSSNRVSQVYPLSLLAFAAAARDLALTREPLPSGGSEDGGRSQVEGLDHLYRRHVKPKKQHEIKCLAKIISKVALDTHCQNVIDMGSGQGHLARYLAYDCGLTVTAVEAVGEHLAAATKYDGEVEKDKAKKAGEGGRNGRSASPSTGTPDLGTHSGSVRHIQLEINPGCSAEELLSQLGLAISQLERYIIIGLHTCGDLGATVMKAFRESDQIVGLVSLGCCYMKLSSHENASSAETVGYPLSDYIQSLLPESMLSYEAREVACHSIEDYCQRLEGDGEMALGHLKIHSHRAAVETVLRKYNRRRAQVRISKRISKLPFRDYAQSLLASIELPPLTDKELEELSELVRDWEKVAMFFMLRLTLAPCVESLLLLDRALYLMGRVTSGHTHKQDIVNVDLLPIFEPKLSPRNIALIAVKKV